jgi:hypothetical protein
VELFGKFYEVPQSFKKFVKFLQSLGRFAPGMAAMAHCLIIGWHRRSQYVELFGKFYEVWVASLQIWPRIM